MRSLRLRIPALLILLFAWGCAAQHAPGDLPNRDRHGPRDVERYIRGLQREERVRELDPEGVVRVLEIPETAVVADLGSGPGVFTFPIAKHVSKGLVYAVDVEPRQLDALRERMLAEGVENIVPVLASYSDPHLPPQAIDWIFIVDTYHHIEDRVAYLRGLRRDLASGGRLVILEYKPGDLPVGPPAAHKIPHDVRLAELGEAGFALEKQFEIHTFHDFEVWRVQPGTAETRQERGTRDHPPTNLQLHSTTVSEIPED
jgi:SAM-dependent methyltransferase